MSPDPSNKDNQPIAEIDKLIHEPARLMILATLFVVESADFLWVERQTGLTRGNLSSHMSKLEDAGYVRVNKSFVNNSLYSNLHSSYRRNSRVSGIKNNIWL